MYESRSKAEIFSPQLLTSASITSLGSDEIRVVSALRAKVAERLRG